MRAAVQKRHSANQVNAHHIQPSKSMELTVKVCCACLICIRIDEMSSDRTEARVFSFAMSFTKHLKRWYLENKDFVNLNKAMRIVLSIFYSLSLL